MQTFREYIEDNKRNSVLLVMVLILFTLIVIGVLSLALLVLFSPDTTRYLQVERALLIGGCAAVFTFLLTLWSYYQGDQMILAISGAKPLTHAQDPQLYNVVEEIALAAGVPMPKVFLILDNAPNAFATGRDPRHAAIAITSGLRTKLNREELQGVIAHEMSHIRNYDIRLMMLMAVLIGTLVMLTDLFWQIIWRANWGGGFRSNDSDRGDGKGNDKGGGIFVLIILGLAIVLSLIAPLLAQIIQFAVSRQREFLADATAVEFTRNPIGLANALKKIEADPAELRTANRGTAHLYIVNPIKKFEARANANSVFASHPPIQDRITRLLNLVGQTPLNVS